MCRNVLPACAPHDVWCLRSEAGITSLEPERWMPESPLTPGIMWNQTRSSASALTDELAVLHPPNWFLRSLCWNCSSTICWESCSLSECVASGGIHMECWGNVPTKRWLYPGKWLGDMIHPGITSNRNNLYNALKHIRTFEQVFSNQLFITISIFATK